MMENGIAVSSMRAKPLFWLVVASITVAVGLLSIAISLELMIAILVFVLLTAMILVDYKTAFYPLVILVATGSMLNILLRNAPWVRNDRISLHMVFVVYCLFLWMVARSARFVPGRDKTPLDVPLLLLLGWAAISLLWARNLNHSLFQMYLLASNYLVFFLVGTFLITEEMVKKYVKWLLVIGSVFAVSSLVSFFVDGMVNNSWGTEYFLVSLDFEAAKRARGFAIHNTAASWFNFFLSIAWVLFIFNDKSFITRRMLIFPITLMEVALIATKSRAGMTTQLAMVFFLLMMSPEIRKRKFIRRFLQFLLFFIFSMFIATINNPFGVLKRFGIAFSSQVEQSLTAVQRLTYWADGASAFFSKSYGIFGLGIGGFQEYVYPVPNSHSLYFSALFNFGYIGLLLFFVVVITLILQLLKYKNLEDGFIKNMSLAFMACMLSIGMTSFVDFYYGSAHVWLFLGWGMGILQLASRKQAGVKSGKMVGQVAHVGGQL